MAATTLQRSNNIIVTLKMYNNISVWMYLFLSYSIFTESLVARLDYRIPDRKEWTEICKDCLIDCKSLVHSML